MEMKIKERYAISARIEEWRKGSVAAFSGEWGSNGDWSVSGFLSRVPQAPQKSPLRGILFYAFII
jgi:hypothetical protein